MNILISSAAHKTPLIQAMQQAARKLAPQAQVVAGDLNTQVLSAYTADAFWPMPPTDAAYLEEIIAGCQAREVRVILPTRDGELLFWAHHAARLESVGIKVIVAPVPALTTCLDKQAFADFGQRHQLPMIPCATTPQTLEHETDRWVVKERYGAGSRLIGLNLSMEQALAHAQQLQTPVFQPYMTGQEISIDAWLDRRHNVKGLILRRRDLVIHGESQVTTSFRHPAIESQAKIILKALQLTGPVVLQALVDTAEHIHIIECNPRFGGASTVSIAAGLDSLYWSLVDALGGESHTLPFTRIAGEIRQVRMATDYYSPVSADAAHCAVSWRGAG